MGAVGCSSQRVLGSDRWDPSSAFWQLGSQCQEAASYLWGQRQVGPKQTTQVLIVARLVPDLLALRHCPAPCSSLLAAARSVLEVVAESMDGVPGRLPVLELPAEPRPPARFGGVRFF